MVLEQPLFLPPNTPPRFDHKGYLLGVLGPGTVLDCVVSDLINGPMQVRVLIGPYRDVAFELPDALLLLRMRHATALEALLAGNTS